MGKILFIVGMLILMSSTASFGAAIGLPQTGQIACYDTSGTVISCTGTGQDGELQKGVSWPSPRFEVTGTGNACILDHLTGLMWVRNPGTSEFTWQGALTHANTLDLCGYTDWRVPNINEMNSLIHEGEAYPNAWLIGQGFTSMHNGNYWTSTTTPAKPSWAFHFHFSSGVTGYNVKTVPSFYVLPVRGPDAQGVAPVWRTGQTTCWDESGAVVTCANTGQDGGNLAGVAWPAPRFEAGKGGEADCVTDNLTGLMWVKVADDVSRSWSGALNHTNSLDLCGHSDWRLLNVVELRSLANYEEGPIYDWLNTQGFTGVNTGPYWSSTTAVYSASNARQADLSYGATSYMTKTWSDTYKTWAVRNVLNPDISLSPGALDFGDVVYSLTSPIQTITITNTGSIDLVISSIEKEGTSPTMFAAVQGATNGCAIPNATVIPGASCTLDVTFTPTALDLQEALLYINSNDPDTPRVQVSLSGTGIDNPAPIVPIAPSNGTTFNSCSYFAPPLFQWNLNDTFQKLEIRIFTPANPAKPVKVKIKDPATTQFQMTQAIWKKVLRLAIPGEATLQWKIIGSNKGQSAVESEFFEMGIDALSPVASFTLTPPSQANLPAISWENNCATKFRVWFGPDPDFTKKKKFSFTDQSPVDDGGNFSRTLTPGQWNAVRKLVDDQVGSDIYWYVESWDIVKRYNVTKPDVFTLEP